MSGIIAKGFRKRVDDFLSASGMSPTRLGREAVNDPNIIFDIRKNRRQLTIETADRILSFIKNHQEGGANGGEHRPQQ